MADVNMPGYLDYGKMMEMNPIAYGQAQEQLGLAQQFQQQGLQQAQQKTLADMMKNDQEAKMNPLRVKQLEGTNLGQDYTNRNSAVTTNINEKTAPQQYQAKVMELANKLTDGQIKERENYVSLLPRTNAQEIAFAENERGKLASVIAAREKARLEKEQAMSVAQEHSRATLGAAGISAGASKYAADKASERAIEVAKLQKERELEKANMHQTLVQRIAELSRVPGNEAQIEYLKNIAQQVAPAYGTAINLPALAEGNLGRNADKPAGPKLGTPENPIKLN